VTRRFPWLEYVWLSLGVVFHLALALTTELGIFPWAMLALYPAWLHPDEWAGFWAWLTARRRPAAEPRPSS
jgi:hypothetical protein